MRLVMLSTDARVLVDGDVRDRVLSYATIVDELTLVVVGGKGESQNAGSNIRIITTGGFSKSARLMKTVILLWRVVSKKKCDVVSVQDPFLVGFVTLCIARLRGIALQVQVHTDCFSPEYRSESLRRFFEWCLAHMVVRGATCVRVVSLRIRRSVSKIIHVPVSVLPIMVRPRKDVTIKPKEFTAPFTVLTVARLTPEKQINVLIDAIALLPKVHLIIVGDGSERKKLEERRARKNLFDRVAFVGWQNEVSSYYAHAQCYVQASLYEGYGLSLVEASLYGLPSISTDVGVVGEMFESEKDILVARNTPESIAEAITRLQEHPALRKEIGDNARAKATTALTTPEAYLKAYKDALSSCEL